MQMHAQLTHACFKHAQPLSGSLSSPAGVRVLVDPWLVERLVFAGQAWLFTGTKDAIKPESFDIDKLAEETDLILLSQVRSEQPCRNAKAS